VVEELAHAKTPELEVLTDAGDQRARAGPTKHRLDSVVDR
jgi:hypothetical protein